MWMARLQNRVSISNDGRMAARNVRHDHRAGRMKKRAAAALMPITSAEMESGDDRVNMLASVSAAPTAVCAVLGPFPAIL